MVSIISSIRVSAIIYVGSNKYIIDDCDAEAKLSIANLKKSLSLIEVSLSTKTNISHFR